MNSDLFIILQLPRFKHPQWNVLVYKAHSSTKFFTLKIDTQNGVVKKKYPITTKWPIVCFKTLDWELNFQKSNTNQCMHIVLFNPFVKVVIKFARLENA
ncbi:hypothetical protein T01_12528 [Trichinella spiralis]|uniref:Uncharacterized protein n=1 Tax=Trichinella spiralis TaxID=6334 RepID=A0A0V1BPD2_TRISP|nr:hypothetical protein T01_12528 [Trichinella spiralis]